MLIPLLIALSTPALSKPVLAQTESCYVRVQNYEEFTNCPILTGTFSNGTWQVTLGRWEPGAYSYRGKNLITGDSIELVGSEVKGTTDRPQYLFSRNETLYRVTFQPADPDTIRLEVFADAHEVLNVLLYR